MGYILSQHFSDKCSLKHELCLLNMELVFKLLTLNYVYIYVRYVHLLKGSTLGTWSECADVYLIISRNSSEHSSYDTHPLSLPSVRCALSRLPFANSHMGE